jgi:hypothetical protein
MVLAALVASPQADSPDHAPTAAQCLADVRLWQEQITEYQAASIDHVQRGTPNNTAVVHQPVQQLARRAVEMGECATVDPSNANDYDGALVDYESARKDRYEQFVIRHKLEHQLFQEDAAGIR